MRRICHWLIIQKDPMEGQDLLEGRAQSMHGARLALEAWEAFRWCQLLGGKKLVLVGGRELVLVGGKKPVLVGGNGTEQHSAVVNYWTLKKLVQLCKMATRADIATVALMFNEPVQH